MEKAKEFKRKELIRQSKGIFNELANDKVIQLTFRADEEIGKVIELGISGGHENLKGAIMTIIEQVSENIGISLRELLDELVDIYEENEDDFLDNKAALQKEEDRFDASLHSLMNLLDLTKNCAECEELDCEDRDAAYEQNID